MHSFALGALSLSLPLTVWAQSYTLQTTYQGSNFFSQWNYSTAPDVNFGFATFESFETATSQKLTFINDAGNAIVKVDNTTVGNPADTTFGRGSVYMTSNAPVPVGSLVLFDALHVPAGCSVWPAFFMEGAGVVWPNKGEIDIFENVNLATVNQYSLHTLDGCTHGSGAVESGTVVSTDCFNQTNSNQGCIVKETQPDSFGAGFNNNGGGAFALLFNTDGIKFWFFPRSKIPSDFSGSSPNPSGWGTPSADYSASGCNIGQFFGPQTLILDIDICGAFAGDGGAFSQTCQGQCVDLLKTPSNYDQAYFEIQFIKVFTEGGSGTSTTSTGTSKQTGSSTSTSSTSTSTGSGGGAIAINTSMMAVGAATAISMFVAGFAMSL